MCISIVFLSVCVYILGLLKLELQYSEVRTHSPFIDCKKQFLSSACNISSCGRQKGPSMMTRYARSYSLQKGPSLEDSVE